MANGYLLKVLSTIAHQNSCGMRSKPINPNSLDLSERIKSLDQDQENLPRSIPFLKKCLYCQNFL